VTAAEVRKRLAQYYQQPEHKNELRIHLNSGSYVPHFIHTVETPIASAPESPIGLPIAGEAPDEPSESIRAGVGTNRNMVRNIAPNRRLKIWVGVAILGLMFVGILFNRMINSRRHGNEVIWQPVLKGSDPVLFVLPDLPQTDIGKGFQQDDHTNLLDHLRQGRIVDFGDSVAMSRLAAYPARSKSANTFNAMDSGCQFGAQQTGVGCFVGQPAHSCKSDVDSTRSEAALLQVKPIPQDHGFIECQPWLRTIPGDEFINGMLIPSPREEEPLS
jgi:hypothetical protein